MSVFDAKTWNSNVFQKYLETVPRVKQNALIKAGVFRTRGDMKAKLTEQVGGNYVTEPIVGRIGGDVQNYDGDTNITTTGLDTFSRGMVVAGRAKAWREYDFTADITGKDFMEEIAKQVAEYWDDVDQTDVLSILKGIFGVTAGNFSTSHTLDITSEASAADQVVGVTSLNNAIQKAGGANKNMFTLAIMHSQVATNLENKQLLEYWKYTDKDGVQKQSNLASWNGRTVLIDDDLVDYNYTAAGVYQVQVKTAAKAGDKITINGVDYTWIANGETPSDGEIALPSTNNAANEVSALVTALNLSEDARLSGFTWSAGTSSNADKLIATEDSGHYGEGPFTAVVTKGQSGTMAVGEVTITTAPVNTATYTTYILGKDAFDYCDCGAKVPNETYRDPHSKGGLEELITRQRKMYAPKGFSFTNTSLISPTAANFATAANWGLATATDGVTLYPVKAIPIARIKSLG